MLCTENVSTQPPDYITDCKPTVLDMNKPKKDEKKHEIGTQSGGPGIVARLMGLDSLPQDTNWAPKVTTPDSFSRSRSVNFADYLLKFDLNDHQSHQLHRRARTSVSFREVPASFQQLKSSDFLVVYLDDVDNSSKEMRKSELGFKRKEKSKSTQSRREYKSLSLKDPKEKERTDNKISKLKNEPRKRIVQQKTGKQNGSRDLGSVLPCKKKDQKDGGGKLKVLKRENQKKSPEKFTRKRKNHQQASNKIQPIESSAENLIPVSVLEEIYNLYSEGHSRSMNADMKTEVKSNVSYDNELKLRTALKKEQGKAESTEMAEYFAELAEQLRRLAEEDLSRTYWISTRAKNMLHFEGVEDICMEFEWDIIDVLLDEVTCEIIENMY